MVEALTLCLCTRMYQRHSVNSDGVLTAAVDPMSGCIFRNPTHARQRSQALGVPGRLVHLDQTKPGIGRHPNHQRRAAAQQDADLDSLLRQPRSTYFCEQSQTHVEVPESPSPHCRWQRRQPGGARWTGPPSCANSCGGIPHAYSQRPAHRVRGSCQSKRLAHDFRPGSRGYQFRHRGRGLPVTPRR